MSNKHKLLIVLFLAALAGATHAWASDSRGSQINWSTYDEAQRASHNNRKLFIYFFTERCGYCRKMEETTFKDSAVIDYLNSNYIPIRVNAGQEERVASRFSIQGVPDLRFLTTEGDSIARWPGYIESDKLISILQYIHTDSYKEMKYSDFLKETKGAEKD